MWLDEDPVTAEILVIDPNNVASLIRIKANNDTLLRPKLGQRILAKKFVARAEDRKILAFLIKFLLHLWTIPRAKIRRVSRIKFRKM